MLKRTTLFTLSLLLTIATSSSPAQTAGQGAGREITPNFKDTDITQVIEAVSDITGKTFIVDPRVRGVPVNIFSQKKLTPEEFYETFLSVLALNGFVAMPAGSAIKIMPADPGGRVNAGNDLPDRISASSDEIVTTTLTVTNVSAAALATNLRSLLSTQAHFTAYPPTNTIIISDRASNVNRLMRIIRRIDQAGDSEMDVITLENASATDVVRLTNQLFQAPGAEGGSPVRVVADERTNRVILSGEKAQRLKLKTLIIEMDTPVSAGGATQHRYLKYAEAEKIAAILKDQATATAQVAGGPPVPAAPGAGGGASQLGKDVTILADPETNSLMITAPPKITSQLMEIVDKLDIRRAMVQVEAFIVDVALNKSSALGVNWAVFSEEDDTRIPAGGFINPVSGVSIVDFARAVDDPTTAPAGLNSGFTTGIGRIATNGVSFAAMLRALRSDENSNVVSFPQVTVKDNTETELNVGRQVPFLTGSFTNTGGGGNNGAVNPFQTIQREDVGTKLKITPQINEGGGAISLKIELESSDLLPASAAAGAVDLVTSKRTINTEVMTEDGGIIVLGGLISENYNRQESRVPFLGRIPVLGNAFKTRSGQNNRTNLMVFIRTTIVRDGAQAAIITNSKYNQVREDQKKVNKGEDLPLFPFVPKPILPELTEEQRKAAERPPGEPPAPTTAPPPEPLKQQ